MWFVGSDWADQHHDLAILDGAGQVVTTFRVPHSVEGMAKIHATLHALTDQPEQVVCVVETAQGLLITSLLEAGWSVYPVHPTSLRQLRHASGAKTDALDARLLARKGHADWPDVRRLTPDSPLIQELKTLTRDQDTLIQERTRLLNQLTACLKAYCPAMVGVFSSLCRPVLARLSHPASGAGSHRGGHRGAPAQDPLSARTYQSRAGARTFCSAALAGSRSGQSALDAGPGGATGGRPGPDSSLRPGHHYAQHADAPLFASLPGAGKRLAPRLLAEWGDDRSRYLDASQVQAVAGTAPVLVAYRRVHRRTACVQPWRQAL